MADRNEKTVEIIVNGQKAGASIKEMTAAARALNAEIRNLKPGTEAFVKAAGDLKKVNKSLDETKDKVKTGGTAWGQFRGQMGKMASEAPVIGNALKLMTGPFGLIIAAVTLIIGVFSKFTPLVDKVKNIMAGLMGIVDELVQRFILFGEGLADIAQGNFDEGFDKISKSTDNLGDSLQEAYKHAADFEKKMVAIRDAERQDRVQDSAIEAQVDILIAKSKNLALSYKERIGFLAQAKKLEEENYKGDVIRADAKIKAIEDDLVFRNKALGLTKKDLQEFVAGNKTREEMGRKMSTLDEEKLQALEDVYIARNNLDQQSVALQERINSRQESFQEKENQRQDKNRLAREKVVESTRKMFEQLDQIRASSITDEQEREEAALLATLEKNKAAIKAEVGDKKLKNDLLLALDQEYVRQLADLKGKFATKQAAEDQKEKDKAQKDAEDAIALQQRIEVASLEVKVKTSREGSEARLKAEEDLLTKKMEIEISNMKLTEEEKALIHQTYLEAREKLEDDFDKKRLEKAANITGQVSSMYSQASGSILQIMSNRDQKEINEDKKKTDKLKAQQDRLLESGKISKQQYAAAVAQIEEQSAARTAEIKKKAFQRQKEAQIIQAGIDIAAGVLKALASSPPPVNIILAGITAGLGAIQLAAIAGAPEPTFAKGGLLPQGASHSAGGIKLVDSRSGRSVGEIEGGEPILSRKTYAANRSLIIALLRSNGQPLGSGFSRSPSSINYGAMSRTYAEGGFLPNRSSNTAVNPAASASVGLTSNDIALLTLAVSQNTSASQSLLQRLNDPIFALLTDTVLRDVQKRLEEFEAIKQASSV